MWDQNPFRDPSRATSENAVNRILIYQLSSHCSKALTIQFMQPRLRYAESLAFAPSCIKEGIIGIGERNGGNRIQHIYYVRNPLCWHFAVDWHIEIATCSDSHETNKRFDSPVNKHKNRSSNHLSRGLYYGRAYSLGII